MIIETLSAVVILGIAVLFLNPGNLSMPQNMQSMLILIIIIAFLTFATYLFKEKSSDEREAMHVLTAGRISYLVGAGILTLGIIVQALRHAIDQWIVIALCGMVFSKLISRIYSQKKR